MRVVSSACACRSFLLLSPLYCSSLRWGTRSARVLAFLAEGQLAATEAKQIRLWDPATGQPVRTLFSRENQSWVITTFLASADRRTLVIGSTELQMHGSRLQVVEVASGRVWADFRAEQGVLACLALSPDGRKVASAGTDSPILVWNLAGDGHDGPPTQLLSLVEVAARWRDLDTDDARLASRAIFRLAAAPGDAVPSIRARLGPVLEGSTSDEVTGWVSKLDAPEYATREAASRQLHALGSQAVGPLRKALEGGPSPELRQRAESLLATIQSGRPPRTFRELRALAVLEAAKTPEAVAVLQALAKGPSTALVTSLQRLL